jgi:PKD repeat protein
MLSIVIPRASRLPFSWTLQQRARVSVLCLCVMGAAAGIDAQIADFSIAPIAPSPSATVNLSYNGACPGSLTSLIWEFGDNQTFTQDPNAQGCATTHSYTTSSIYRVRLTVLPSGNSLSKDLGVLTLANGQNTLTPAFTWSPATPTPGQSLSFTDLTAPTNSVGQWTWEFDDGTNSFLRNPDKSFPAGNHAVSLTVQNQADLEQITLTVVVEVPPPPVADFSFTPTSPAAGALVQFLDESTGSPTSWSWNFGDPTSSFPNSSTSKNPTHRYVNPGTYTVRLIASNAGGASAPHTEVVIVGQIGPIPVASFSYSPTSPTEGDQVLFTDTSTGSPTSWSWNFDDPTSGGSNTSTLRNPSHVFSAAGTYDVTLRATNANGTSEPATETVTVAPQQGACHSDAQTLCVQANRFSVTASYRTATNATGSGAAIRLTDDSGYFYFFDANNVEVVTKVLNGCFAPFNSYWVFAAGLTNVEVTLTVTDTSNGTVKTYRNPLGTPFQPIQDTSAFATCP